MVYHPARFISEYPACRKASIFSSDGWWLNRWPILGWMETFVKVFAWTFVPSAIAPVSSTATTSDVLMSAEEFSQAFIMGLASVLLAAAIVDRLVYRELVSIVFVFPNNWAHWSVFLALARGSQQIRTESFRAFLWLMFAGDVIKLVFFAVHGFEIKAIAKVIVYSLVLLFALMYAAVLAIEYGHFRSSVLRFHAYFLQRMPFFLKAMNAR